MKICENGVYREMTPEEIEQAKALQEDYENDEAYKSEKIMELKQNLANTDYIACKLAEGVATREEYSKELLQRQAWREEINNLES